jgi:hypothetical protein
MQQMAQSVPYKTYITYNYTLRHVFTIIGKRTSLTKPSYNNVSTPRRFHIQKEK